MRCLGVGAQHRHNACASCVNAYGIMHVAWVLTMYVLAHGMTAVDIATSGAQCMTFGMATFVLVSCNSSATWQCMRGTA